MLLAREKAKRKAQSESKAESNPSESPIKLPLEVRRKLGALRIKLVVQSTIAEMISDKADGVLKVYKRIDRKLKAMEKALETKEDIEVFEAYIDDLEMRLAPYQATLREKASQIEELVDALEALV